MVCQQEPNGVWKILTILSFFMLLAMTIASKPIEKISVALTTKYEKQAKAKICDKIHSSEQVYYSIMRHIWMGGCMTTLFETNIKIFSKHKQRVEDIRKQWADQKGEFIDMADSWCSGEYTELLTERKMDEKILSKAYYDFGCLDTDPKDRSEEE